MLSIYYILGTLLGGEVTIIEEEVCVLNEPKLCCEERQINRKMLSCFGKHRNSEVTEVIPGLDPEGGTRSNCLHN